MSDKPSWLRQRAEAAAAECESPNFGQYPMAEDIAPYIEAVAREFAERALKTISSVGPDVGLRKGMFQVNMQRSQCGLPTLAHALNKLDVFIAEAIAAADLLDDPNDKGAR